MEDPLTQKMNTNPPRSRLTGGGFIVDDATPDDIFISEEFTEEQLMIKEMVIDFCVQNIQEPFFKNGRELEATLPEDRNKILALLKKAGDLGLCGISISEAYGGMGLDFNTGILFNEALASGFAFATTLGAQTSIGSLPIYYYGNEQQKQQYLPDIASGKLIASYALTEPNSGSDANSARTKAVLSADGTSYSLNGQKIWITNGGFADVYIVFAKIEDDKNLSAFIVERNYPGFSVGEEAKKMGIKASSTVQIFFDNCIVPSQNLLGDREAGFKMALNILNTGRIKIASGGVGAGKFSVTRGIEYALKRQQFDQPIANFGAIKQKIGTIITQTYALEAAVYRTGKNVDEKINALVKNGVNDGASKLNGVKEFAIECAILKVVGADLACYATDEVMQIHGGMGYAAELGLEMAYRDSRITKIYEGTNDINGMLSVAELIKKGLKTKEIDLNGAGKKIPFMVLFEHFRWGKGLRWKREQRLIKGLKNTFLLILGAAGKKLKQDLIKEQEIILNLSSILAEAYVAESVYLKVRKLASSNQDIANLSIQEKIAQLYLYKSLNKVQNEAKEAIDSFASGFEKRILNYFVGKLLPPYLQNPKALSREITDHALIQKKYPF